MMCFTAPICAGGGGGGGGQVVNEYLLYLLQTNIFICRVKLNLDVGLWLFYLTVGRFPFCRMKTLTCSWSTSICDCLWKGLINRCRIAFSSSCYHKLCLWLHALKGSFMFLLCFFLFFSFFFHVDVVHVYTCSYCAVLSQMTLCNDKMLQSNYEPTSSSRKGSGDCQLKCRKNTKQWLTHVYLSISWPPAPNWRCFVFQRFVIKYSGALLI